MRALFAGVCAGLLLGASGVAPARADLSGAQLVVLGNGARVLLVPDSAAVAVEVGAWYDAGLRIERPGSYGITRLLERLMLRGPAGGESPAQRVIAEGGAAGSFTTPDLVCFYETLPPDSLELGLRIEAQRMRSLSIAPADFEAERSRARAERGSPAEGGAALRGIERLYGALYPGHPYRLPPSGTDADLARITLQDCQAFHRDRFGPGHALITVVGRFAPGRALREARALVGAVPARGAAAKPAAPPASAAARERRVTERSDFELRLLFLGWRAPGQGAADAAALDLLGRVLSGGAGSRLTQLAAAPGSDLLLGQAGYDGRRDGGMFYAYGVLKPGADSARVEKDLIQRVESLAAGPVEADELERARHQAESGILFGWQTVHGRSLALGSAQLVGSGYREAWDRLRRLRALTAADLQRVARTVLKSEARSVVWRVPAAGAAGQGAPR